MQKHDDGAKQAMHDSITQKNLLPFLAAGALCMGLLTVPLASAQCSTNPTDSNYAPSCGRSQCSAGLGACPAATAIDSGEMSNVPPTMPSGSFHVQVPNLAPSPSELSGNSANQGANGAAMQRITWAGPLTERSEFERFAEDVAGRRLPVYGRRLFEEAPTTFAPLDRVPVASDYVLGPGDQLLVRAWGKIDIDGAVTVDRSGQIFLPTVGTVTVAGLRYDQVESYLKSAIARLYKGFELNVTMGQLRSMQIFVLGNARQPGTYTISSLSTLVNALFLSGGPSATGSMRHIEVRRGNQDLTDFDVYDLLQKGDKSRDVRLLPGDVIYIPPVGPQVAIAGSVGEAGIYELRGETTIADALKDAGGLSNLAGTDRAVLERIEDRQRRRVDEFPLDAAGLRRILHDGDILEIFPISPQFEKAVTLQGNVANPGRYPWHDGLRVSDLIPSRDALITRRYWKQENHLVAPSANFGSWSQPYSPDGVAAGDRRQLFESGRAPAGSEDWNGQRSQAEAWGISESQPEGSGADAWNGEDWTEQNGPSDSRPLDVMADLSRRTAEINWDYAAIERLDRNDLSTRVIAFNLGKALDDPASSDNQVLQPGDVVTVFSRKDLPLPEDKHAAFVRVSGEVNAPGIYRIQPGETLRDIVERAGGLTSHAYLYASQLNRVSTRMAEEEQLKLSINQMQRELVARYAAAPGMGAANAAGQQTQLSAGQAAIAQLSQVRPTGRVVLDMTSSANAVADIPKFPLEDGDNFYIPPRYNTVQVSGAVYNENAFRYEARKRLSRYLDDAGGPTRQADIKHIFLIRADGTVVSRQTRGAFWHEDFEKLTLLPGDAIVVPTKFKSPSSLAQQLPFVTQMISQTALTGAVMGTSF